tara:strand:- start:57 stop:1475 length:1419 start_codon:yes stop_codon:yes gene_type:complete
MYISHKQAESSNFEFVIIGSGVAGISLAIELEKLNKKILLIEAGEKEFSENSQDFYKGTVLGDKYYNLKDARLRMFGGSSNHWAGWCKSLDDYDFNNKNYINNKWAIDSTDLVKFEKKAEKILELDKKKKDINLSENFKQVFFQNSPPVNFNTKYLKKIIESKNIFLLLDTTIYNFQLNQNTIISAEGFFKDKTKCSFNGKNFFLCCGGIENSRILLYSNKLNNNNLVFNNKILGTHWMEHPHGWVGMAIMDTKKLGLKEITYKNQDVSFIAPRKSFLDKNKLLNSCFRFFKGDKNNFKKELLLSLPSSLKILFKKHTFHAYSIYCASEQLPSINNKISLSNKTDQFSLPRAQLEWRKNQLDLKTIKEPLVSLGKYFVDNNIGRIQLNDKLAKNEFPNSDLGGYHHMGGTRMAIDPNKGVVDKNLKVFGKKNFFILGSSVFPSGGHANPTYTITLLSLRLADYIKKNINKFI